MEKFSDVKHLLSIVEGDLALAPPPCNRSGLLLPGQHGVGAYCLLHLFSRVRVPEIMNALPGHTGTYGGIRAGKVVPDLNGQGGDPGRGNKVVGKGACAIKRLFIPRIPSLWPEISTRQESRRTGQGLDIVPVPAKYSPEIRWNRFSGHYTRKTNSSI